MTDQGKILEGITVVDLSTFVTGGFCLAVVANQSAGGGEGGQPRYGGAVPHPRPPLFVGG